MSAVEACVELLRCEACKRELPNLAFSADTDMPTAGLASLSSMEGREVIAVSLSAEELSTGATEGLVERISGLLDRGDLCRPLFVGAITKEARPQEGFAAFAARWQSPIPRYSCPFCSGGEMTPAETLSLAEFTAQGGKITDLTGTINAA